MISIEILCKDFISVLLVILYFIKYVVRKIMWFSGKNMNFVLEKFEYEYKFVYIFVVKVWINLLIKFFNIYFLNYL